MSLTNQDLVEIVAFRRALHARTRNLQRGGKTATRGPDFLADTGPDRVLTGMGGHGVAMVYDSESPARPCFPLRARRTADRGIVRRADRLACREVAYVRP